MKPQAFKRIKTDGDTFKLQENANLKFTDYDLNPFIKGQLLENVVITTSDTDINHSLGQTPQGWFILDRNASATVWRTSAFNNKTLTLRASASVTVNLWVF